MYGRDRFVTTAFILVISEFVVYDHVIPSSDLITRPSPVPVVTVDPVAINNVPFHVIEYRIASVYAEGFVAFDHITPSVDVEIIYLFDPFIHCPTATQIYPFHATSLAVD